MTKSYSPMMIHKAVPILVLTAQFLFAAGGLLRDPQGRPIAGAALKLLNTRQAVMGTAQTGSEGEFRFDAVPPGDYVLVVRQPAGSERRLSFRVESPDTHVDITVDRQPVSQSVTVTAVSGSATESGAVPQSVNVIGRAEVAARAKSVTAQIAAEETGIALQRTSPTISGIFVRGLTGNKVNVFVDGVRYSTSAMRGGINTFFNLVDATGVDTVEILRGPSSAQYGSDALGGSVQFLSTIPEFAGRPTLRNSWSTFFNSADAGFGSNLTTSYTRPGVGLVANLAGQRSSRLRTGGGLDSRSSLTRFLGLPSSTLYSGRMPDTAFTQYSGLARLYWTPRADSQVIAHYQRGQQDGGKRFDQLLGGDGNLIADLRNLMLDFFYLQYNKQKFWFLDQAAVTGSYNTQREERVNQGGNGNPRAAINHEYERTSVQGVQAGGSRQVQAHLNVYIGGEFYRERIHAPSFAFNPGNGTVGIRRGRVPDMARYRSGGGYAQAVYQALPSRLRLFANVRYSGAEYESLAADSPIVGGKPLWPDDFFSGGSATYRLGAVATPLSGFSIVGNVSRGFRAPHITDLGTLGLTGSGYEVSADMLRGMGAMVGTTAGTDAVSSGTPVTQVKPEISFSYEGGVRIERKAVRAEAMFFLNDINDNITKQALILPPGAVGTMLGSEPVTSQMPSGVVFVAASSSPVLVRSNYDNARLYGIDSRLEVRPAPAWTALAVFTFVRAEDRRTGLAPNIEGGTPPANGIAKLRYAPLGRRFWIEPFANLAWRQDRLSSLDLQDRRTGAGRTRSNIAAFFANGALVRGLVSPSGILIPTGETLAQVQDRVLGRGVTSAPLYSRLAGYGTINLRAGWRIGEASDLVLELENLTDKNYRGISWGVDAPGRGVYVRYSVRF